MTSWLDKHIVNNRTGRIPDFVHNRLFFHKLALAVVCIMCLLDYFVTTRLLQGSMKEKALKKRIHFIDLLFSPSVWMIILIVNEHVF